MVIFNRFLLVILLSFSALQAKGLGGIAHLPHAQQLITEVFKERGLDPEDFEFTFPDKKGFSWTFFYDPKEDSFTFDLFELERVNQTQTLPSCFLQELIDCGNYGFQTRLDHFLCIKGVIGHELQHQRDRDRLLSFLPISFSDRDFSEKTKEIRGLEVKADLFQSSSPEVLRATAVFFLASHNRGRSFFLGDDKAYFSYLKNADPLHPFSIKRHDYLCAAAAQLELQGFGFGQR